MKKFVNNNMGLIISFLSIFVAMIVYICRGSMLDMSGDAADIWHTITTIGTPDVYGSYVLYKGFNAVYPYLWLYRLALIVGVNQELFIKIFYAFAFSYVTILGLPGIIEKIANRNVNGIKRICIAILCFYFWNSTGALTEMMVDLPCLMYFLLMVNSFLVIKNKEVGLPYYLVTGIFVGLCLTASGQYSLPAYLALFIYIADIVRSKRNDLKRELPLILVLILPAIAIKGYNIYYLETFVEELRQKGAWIPTANDWLTIGFPRFSNILSTDSHIYTNRIYDIFKNYYGVDEISMTSGAYSMTPSEYIRLVLHHIPSFAVSYVNSLFIILSPDGGNFNIIRVSIFYILLFFCIFYLSHLFESDKKLFSEMIKIFSIFLLAIVPLLVMCIEYRTCMQLQGLVITIGTIGLFDYKNLNNKLTAESMIRLIVLVGLFVVLCLVHLGTLYDVNYFMR